MKKYFLLIIFIILVKAANVMAQDSTQTALKFSTFTIMQLLPFPDFTADKGIDGTKINFSLRWQIIPLNFSFRANKYVSPLQFFMINPTRRFSGSMELFAQPEYSFGNSSGNSGLSEFTIGTGIRFIIPLKHQGETYAMSLGAKYNLRKDITGAGNDNYYGIEGGIYMFFGMIGLQVNYNFDERSRYSIGLFFKYF